MQTIRTLALLSVVSFTAAAMPLGGCEKKAEPAKPAAGTSKPAKADDHAHKDGDGHDHDKPAAKKDADSHDGHDHGDGHDDGPTTELGEQKAGGFNVKASRDGAITPGKDAAIDVWVTGGTAKVAAVRFWIGTQDGKGSVKAKAEIEKDNWHTHAEIPSPLPTGSKLWVEVEDDKGVKSVVGFDLKL
jgi:hypothetical protein